MAFTIGRIELGLGSELIPLATLASKALQAYINQQANQNSTLDRIEQKQANQQLTLDHIEQKVDKIIMDDQALKALLTKVDDTTNKIASNVQIIGDTTQTISNEMDAF